MPGSTDSVLVIGAGVQGLTTGVMLAESGWPVRIRTAERPDETTSAVAGAIWGPTMLQPSNRVFDWLTRSYHQFRLLAADPTTGVHLAAGTMAARFELGGSVPPEARLLSDMRGCTPRELPLGFVSGYRATLPLIDMPRYLDYLVVRFRAAGGELLVSPVPSLADAAGESKVVINCTGVGAHELVGDPAVHPVWGQHVVVDNPGLDEYFIEVGNTTEFTGCVPHGDRLVLGGVAREHDWSRRASREVTAGILRRVAELDHRLTGLEVRAELVGLRPGRRMVRLDVEYYEGAHIVHNYGHAGSGIALSWGCAYEAAQRAVEGQGEVTPGMFR